MKIPVTDQFLWSLYRFFETTKEVLEPPEIFKLRTFSQIGLNLGKDYWKALEKKKKKKQFYQFIHYLKRKGYIEIANLKQKHGMVLTLKGKEKALKAEIEINGLPKRKDGKWIMVMYDVPEAKKQDRELLRSILKSLHFQSFQKSIWVCSYDFYDQLKDRIRVYSLDSYVKVFLIEEILR